MKLLLYGVITAEGDPKIYVDNRIEDINGMIENTDDASCHPSDVMPYFLKKYWERLKTDLTSGNIKELLQLEDSFALVSKSEKGLIAKLYVNKECYEDSGENTYSAKGSLVNFLAGIGYNPVKLDIVKVDKANPLEVDVVNGDFVFK